MQLKKTECHILAYFQKNSGTLLVITQISYYKNNNHQTLTSSSTITYTLKSRQFIYFPYNQLYITRQVDDVYKNNFVVSIYIEAQKLFTSNFKVQLRFISFKQSVLIYFKV